MTQIEYIIFCNFLTFFFMLFLLTFCIIGKHLPAKLNRMFILIILSTFILTGLDSINEYYRVAAEVHYIRIVVCTLAYIFRPICAALFLMICVKLTKRNHIIIFSLIILDAIITIFNLKYPVIFYFDENNLFHRAKLWFVPYVFSAGFTFAMLISATLQINLNKRKALFVYCVFISVGLGAMVEALNYARFAIPSSGIISQFFLYLFLHTDLYRRDTLTQLYNRATYERNIERFRKNKMVIATLDLNDLKYWNDNYGHAEGDRALLTAVEGMRQSFEKVGLLYRTGGDEFMIIFPKKNVKDLEKNILGFQNYMKTTKYRVALGYAQFNKGDNLEEVIKLSDNLMYEDKHRIKQGLE